MVEEVRALAFEEHRTYETYRTYVEERAPEAAANTLLCLIHQANYLLDRLLRELEQRFLDEGGFTESMHRARSARRRGCW